MKRIHCCLETYFNINKCVEIKVVTFGSAKSNVYKYMVFMVHNKRSKHFVKIDIYFLQNNFFFLNIFFTVYVFTLFKYI